MDIKALVAELEKNLEKNLLTSQYLYSSAVDHKLTEEDFELIKPSDAKEKIIHDMHKKLILSVSQKEQKELLMWHVQCKPFAKTALNKFAAIEDETEKILEMEKTEDESQALLIEYLEKIVNESLVDFSKLLRKLPAVLVKKMIIRFLENGIPLSDLVNAELEAKKTKDAEAMKVVIAEIKKLPEPLRTLVASQYGIDLGKINEDDEDAD